jgi:tetratricopeptide (TPR) repeat protein
MPRKLFVNSVWRFILLRILVGVMAASSTRAQEHPLPQSEQPAPLAGELIPLQIRDFDPWEHADQSLSSADLLKAIPDTLYLYFLGNPRLGVSRGPSIPRTTSAVPQVNQPTAQAATRPSGSFYSLEGQIRLVSPGATNAVGRSQLLMVRYQVWSNPSNPELKPKLVMQESIVTGSGELPERLNEVARVVMDKIVPADAPINAFLSAVETNCFSSDREKHFYQETLSGLLRTTLLNTGFVKPAQDRAGAYAVKESADDAPGGCAVHATLMGKEGQTLATFSETGPKSDVLETQARVNQQIVDALHLESHSVGQKAGSTAPLSPSEYMQAADKYRQVDPDLAAALYRKVLLADPSNEEALSRLAQSLLDSGRPQDVIDLISKPTKAFEFALLASAYLKLNNPKKAIALMNEGLQLHGSDPKFYEQAASILEQTGDYAAAANALEVGQKYATPNKQFAAMANETRRRGAAELVGAGKNAEALPLILASLEEEPNSEWGQRLAGIAYSQSGDAQKAEQHLQEAMRIRPTAYSEAELGGIRLQQKRYADARGFAQQAIEADPRWEGGYDVLVASIQNAEDASEAVAWLKKYLSMEPPDRPAVVTWSYIQLKYLPVDSAAIHQQYEAYKAATKGVPYAEWLIGWVNLVELAMVDNHVEEAAVLADSLSNVSSNQLYRLGVGLYSWLTYLVLGDCRHFETNFNMYLNIVGNGELPDTSNWDLTGTRKFLEAQRSEGKLSPNGMSLVDSALRLLKNPMTPTSVQQFNNDVSHFRNGACPAN